VVSAGDDRGADHGLEDQRELVDGTGPARDPDRALQECRLARLVADDRRAGRRPAQDACVVGLARLRDRFERARRLAGARSLDQAHDADDELLQRPVTTPRQCVDPPAHLRDAGEVAGPPGERRGVDQHLERILRVRDRDVRGARDQHRACVDQRATPQSDEASDVLDVGAQTRVGQERDRAVEQRRRALGLTCRPGLAAGSRQPARARLRVDAEVRGAREARRGRGVAAPQPRPIRGPLELLGESGIRPEGRRGAVPGALVGLVIGGQHARQRKMDVAALAGGQRLVHGAADERMPDAQVRAVHRHQAGGLRGAERIVVDPEGRGRAQDGFELSGVDREQPLCRLGERAQPIEEEALDAPAQRKPVREWLPARQLRGGEAGRQLDQRQCVSARLLEQVLAHNRREVAGDAAGHQGRGRVVRQRRELQGRKPGSLEGPCVPSRTPNSSTIPSASRRRATNKSASADGASSHCASSSRHSTGRRSASSARSVSTASEIKNRSSRLRATSPQGALERLRLRGRQALDPGPATDVAAGGDRRTAAPPRIRHRARPKRPGRGRLREAPSCRSRVRPARRARRCGTTAPRRAGRRSGPARRRGRRAPADHMARRIPWRG
jgi:hypothetical protein